MKTIKNITSVLLVASICTCCSPEIEDFERATLAPAADQTERENQNLVEEKMKIQMGVLKYEGGIPNGTGKIPTCKTGNPAFVQFKLLDTLGGYWSPQSPVTEINGRYSSSGDSLPFGKYVVVETYLLSDQLDTLYALPDEEDTDFLNFADTVLPIEIEVGEVPEVIKGTAMCYEKPNLIISGEIQGDIATMEIVFLNIFLSTRDDDGLDGCIEVLTIDMYANGNTLPTEIYRKDTEPGYWLKGSFQAPVTRQMDSIQVKTFTKDITTREELPLQSKSYTPETLPGQHISEIIYFGRTCN